MSKQAMAEFTAKLAADSTLQQELRDAAGMGDGDELTAGSLIDFAATKGYDFTVEEVQTAGGELDEAQLESVAGGAVFAKYDGVVGEVLSFRRLTTFGDEGSGAGGPR